MAKLKPRKTAKDAVKPKAAAGKKAATADRTAGKKEAAQDKRVRVGWFSFSCCEDNTVVLTEIMNDHWQEWKKLFDFRHASVLRRHNVLDELDIAFIEGAIASEKHAAKLRDIRKRSKLLVAVGSCAVTGMPSAQRNNFDPKRQEEIQFLLARFAALPKVLRVSEVVKVDAEVPGCPMEEKDFLAVVQKALAMLAAGA